jgi:hypothetical protein
MPGTDHYRCASVCACMATKMAGAHRCHFPAPTQPTHFLPSCSLNSDCMFVRVRCLLLPAGPLRCCAAVYFFLPARLPCPFLGGPLPVARASCTFSMRLKQQQQQRKQEQDSRQEQTTPAHIPHSSHCFCCQTVPQTQPLPLALGWTSRINYR